ncbi:MAG TPA: ABC transporter ATP-binding protein [Dongiaceae bacterium]|nr:ABC transporter ATP-binding protein [Dongiaceae bacterium]
MPAISVTDLHLSLTSDAGMVNILRGIDLTIAAGETVGIVGPSGSGKTSLMLLLAGLEQATRGSLRVAGHDLTTMTEDQLALWRRRDIGIVFQAFHLIPTMTAVENVAVPLELAGRRDAFASARLALESVGLGHRLQHYPAQLSGGEQQRVALARALVGRPKLLLADEPTGNLDHDTGQRVMELIFDLSRAQGSTLVLITHDPALAARCDRILHLADGEIRSDERRSAAYPATPETRASGTQASASKAG